MAVPEAPLSRTKYGLVPEGDGWFVVNARDTRWRDYGPLGAACTFEGKRPFKQVGINLNVLNPGSQCRCITARTTRRGSSCSRATASSSLRAGSGRLKAWDFFHCLGGTAHVIMGAGDRPAVVLAVGARGGRKGIVYLVAAAALEHGAGVEQETTKSAEAYARFPTSTRSPYREGWLPSS
jgi:hypothetical protein